MSLLGLDVGTTGSKAVVFDEEGAVLSSAYRDYPTYFPGPGQCELDPEEVWTAVQDVIAKAAHEVKERDPVTAMGISTLGDSVTLLGDDGNPLSGTVLGAADRRAVSQAKRIEEHFSREALFRVTGAPLHAFCVVPKILWFRDNRPDLFSRVWKFAGLQEFVHLRLRVSPSIDMSLAGRTMLMDLPEEIFPRELFSFAGIEETSFFPLSRATETRGTVAPETAERLGLTEHVRVVTGGFDQSCCALGAGVTEAGGAALSVGTLEAITPVFRNLRIEIPLLTGNHGCIPGLVEGMYTSLGYVTTSGAVVKWFVDSFGDSGADDPFSHAMSMIPDGPSGVFVLPYFAGTGTPWLDVEQTGAITGLTLDTGPGDILKGILEGTAFEVRVNIESFGKAGIPVGTLRAIGGGSRSEQWMQIHADVTGIPVQRTAISEAGCRGAAFLAGLGTGVYGEAGDIIGITGIEKVFEPDETAVSVYEERYREYLLLRERVKTSRF